MNDISIALAIFGGAVLTIGLFSRWMRHTVVSENVLAFVTGIIAGPLVLGLLDVQQWADQHVILEQASRFTLAVALMEIALRLPKKGFRAQIYPLMILLGILMPLMWITSSVLTFLILGVPLSLAFLIGAIITPTDPVVANSIVTGSFAESNIPARIRHTLTAESGANDGLAYPFVLISILLIEMSTSDAIVHWVLRTILFEVGGAIAFGVIMGYLAARLLLWSETRHTIGQQAYLMFTLALSLFTLGSASLLGAEGILSVFVTGIVFHLWIDTSDDVEIEPVQGALDQFLSIPIFALIGLTIPVSAWLNLGWPGLLLVIAILVFRRIPAMLLTQRWVEPLRTRDDALYLGWFGPIGIAALYYANFASGRTGLEEIWVVVSLIICSSIVIHGVTAAPLTKLYNSRLPDREDDEKDT